MSQPSLFPPVPVCDPRVPSAAKPRLSRQCLAVLLRLQQGPASNRELSEIALKYTGRLSELRAAGYAVEIVEQDHATGRFVYALRTT